MLRDYAKYWLVESAPIPEELAKFLVDNINAEK